MTPEKIPKKITLINNFSDDPSAIGSKSEKNYNSLTPTMKTTSNSTSISRNNMRTVVSKTTQKSQTLMSSDLRA